MLTLRRLAPLAAAVAVAAALGGCGSSNDLPKDIPPANASGLTSSLNTVLTECEGGDSRGAQSQAAQYQRAVALLPDSVDPNTRKILEETGTNLTRLAGEQAGCESGTTGTSGLQGAQPTESTTTTEDVTTPQSTTTTESTTSTTSSETQAPPESPPAGNDQGSGEGGSNGQGSSGQGQTGGGGSSGSGGGVTPGGKAEKHERVGR